MNVNTIKRCLRPYCIKCKRLFLCGIRKEPSTCEKCVLTSPVLNMNGRSCKAFKLLLVLNFLIFMTILGLYYQKISIASTGVSSSTNTRWTCQIGHAKQKAQQLIENYRSTDKLFIKLLDYFWKQPPQLRGLPYDFKGSELFLTKVLAQSVDHRMPDLIDKLPCRTCAVIGNGYTLRNSSLGKLINKQDVVIRLNNAPVKGYEQDVGNKTTMRLFYPESAYFDPEAEDPSTLLVLVPFKANDLRWLKEVLYNDKRIRKGYWKPPPLLWNVDPTKLRILNPYFFNQTAVKLLKLKPSQPSKAKTTQKPIHPTTGLIAITMALHYCDMVYTAGFGYPDSNNTQLPIHYYETLTMKSMDASEHNLKEEALILKKMADIGAISYLTKTQ